MRGVRGPFAEYDCDKCGVTVSCNLLIRNIELQLDTLKEKNPRLCAGCWKPERKKK